MDKENKKTPKTKTYKVLKNLTYDKKYFAGQTIELTDSSAKHLLTTKYIK